MAYTDSGLEQGQFRSTAMPTSIKAAKSMRGQTASLRQQVKDILLSNEQGLVGLADFEIFAIYRASGGKSHDRTIIARRRELCGKEPAEVGMTGETVINPVSGRSCERWAMIGVHPKARKTYSHEEANKDISAMARKVVHGHAPLAALADVVHKYEGCTTGDS